MYDDSNVNISYSVKVIHFCDLMDGEWNLSKSIQS